jgi:hypothetical protein
MLLLLLLLPVLPLPALLVLLLEIPLLAADGANTQHHTTLCRLTI